MMGAPSTIQSARALTAVWLAFCLFASPVLACAAGMTAHQMPEMSCCMAGDGSCDAAMMKAVADCCTFGAAAEQALSIPRTETDRKLYAQAVAWIHPTFRLVLL